MKNLSLIKKYIKPLFAIAFVSIAFNACFYDKADVVYPSTSATCDTTNVTYSNQIVSILNAQCNYCHGAAANSIGGGIYLNTYAALKPYVTNGSFLNSILQNGKASAMPRNGAKLDNCSILKIQSWINKGTLNN
jgi:cytochrome c5